MALAAPPQIVPADPDEEVFDVYDEHCNLIGQQPRAKVHAEGILHKAVYGFVFNTRNELLIQRRSMKKKIGPGQWDLSVAEHLSPGETFRQAVIRGLSEELGIEATNVSTQPLAPMHLRKLIIPGKICDCEYVESYLLQSYDKEVSGFSPEEVMEVKWASLDSINQGMMETPEVYTEWFREELASLNFFEPQQ